MVSAASIIVFVLACGCSLSHQGRVANYLDKNIGEPATLTIMSYHSPDVLQTRSMFCGWGSEKMTTIETDTGTDYYVWICSKVTGPTWRPNYTAIYALIHSNKSGAVTGYEFVHETP